MQDMDRVTRRGRHVQAKMNAATMPNRPATALAPRDDAELGVAVAEVLPVVELWACYKRVRLG